MNIKKLLTLLITVCLLTGSTSIKAQAATQYSGVSTAISSSALTQPTYTSSELRLMTAIIYCEAGWENYEGMVAVGNVILNRVKSNAFDHVTTIRQAIYDFKRWGVQFSPVYRRTTSGWWTTKGSYFEKALKLYTYGNYVSADQKAAMMNSKKAAEAVLNGTVVVEDYLFFSSDMVNKLAEVRNSGRSYKIIQNHVFY